MDHRHKMTYLKDYCPPAFRIRSVELSFDLSEERTRVICRQCIQRDPASQSRPSVLELNGVGLRLIQVKCNGLLLDPSGYDQTDELLRIPFEGKAIELEIETELVPEANKALQGLYKSGGIYCTQCEAQGFRRITYFLDRPDIMTVYTTKIIADAARYPVLLSNGNLIESGSLSDGRHFRTYHDPFPKPSYLFALVAGKLFVLEDCFKTRSGKTVKLGVYVEPANKDQCAYALGCLKRAMKWDEDRFGLECDLEDYKIVAVDDFNFGAMENKGLNIFNSQYILADPKTATDANYDAIESVVGHEYFHNWTGNRVTCRDWFQITLKEGLTIFRDQEFSMDMGSRPVSRIQDVRVLRDYQFAEDAGPHAHAIRPKEYLEIDNFYTSTVYNKGSEIIRMIHTLIGESGFRKGIKTYFELFDGRAVTTEDFIRAMEKASDKDLSPIKIWYEQAGTPLCEVRENFDATNGVLDLEVIQKPPANPVVKSPDPFYFPMRVGFLDSSGNEVAAELESSPDTPDSRADLLIISKRNHRFRFKGFRARPVISLLRNFTAPVMLEHEQSLDTLRFLFAHDTDPFNRYEAGYRLALQCLEDLVRQSAVQKLSVPQAYINAYASVISDSRIDDDFKAELLVLPSEQALHARIQPCQFEAVHTVREFFIGEIARSFKKELWEIYESRSNSSGSYELTHKARSARRLKNLVLGILMRLETDDYAAIAYRQFEGASNMTDELGAFGALSLKAGDSWERACSEFRRKWHHNSLVMVKWLAVQASAPQPGVLSRIKVLERDPAFQSQNPNHIRALFGAFAQNLICFHDSTGEGYEYLGDKIILIDTFNPSAASHLVASFDKYAQVDSLHQAAMKRVLERILRHSPLSRNTYEMASKTLEAVPRGVANTSKA